MSYQLSHFIQSWLLPPGLILLLMLISLLLGLKYHKSSKIILIATILFFWMISTPFFAAKLYFPLERTYHPLVYKTINKPKGAAIVVLAAGPDTDNTYIRLRYAALLAKKINVPIIVSGGNKNNNKTEAELMRDDLQTDFQMNVLDMEDSSHTTKDESNNLLPILKKHNINTVYLVTQAYHMPRSLYAFKSAFINTDVNFIPAPVGYNTVMSSDPIANYLPQVNALNASVTILHEYVGLLWYMAEARVPFT